VFQQEVIFSVSELLLFIEKYSTPRVSSTFGFWRTASCFSLHC
jgi:hypothetical protein